ncbi:peroxin 20 [Colletotrichum tofieldiae]|nr:peroxin 20 [Colletotrichum tofieldiae]
MADSSCSGASPFKSLVEHGAQDRSLHQDRFAGAPGIHQGFRSSGSAPSAQAQASFGAFLGSNASGQVGPTTLPTYDSSISRPLQDLQAPRMPVAQQGHRFSPELSSAIATAAVQLPHRQNHTANSSIAVPSWAQDFSKFSEGVHHAGSQASGFSATHHHSPVPVGFMNSMMPLQSGPSFFRPVSGSAVNTATSAEADFDLEMDRWMATHGNGRMEDIDVVMEQIAQELEREQEQQSRSVDQASRIELDASLDTTTAFPQSVSLEDTTQRMLSTPVTEAINQQANDGRHLREASGAAVLRNESLSGQVPDLSRLGLDEASDPTVTGPVEQGQSQTEISEAARQILQSVQHEKGDKWKNSRFLLLMKDFRDGNKDIVNDEILETSARGERIAGN